MSVCALPLSTLISSTIKTLGAHLENIHLELLQTTVWFELRPAQNFEEMDYNDQK